MNYIENQCLIKIIQLYLGRLIHHGTFPSRLGHWFFYEITWKLKFVQNTKIVLVY